MLFLTTFRGELYRQQALWRTYRVSFIGQLIANSLVFIVLSLTFQAVATQQGVAYSAQQQTASLIGVLIWNICGRSMGALPFMVQQEAQQGTLEHFLLTSTNFFTSLCQRIAAVTLFQLLETIVIGTLIALALRLPLFPTISSIPILLLTTIGAWGAGFLFAGLALVYKSVGQVASLVANLSLFFTGALVPINSLDLIYPLLKYTFPMTWGIDLLRQSIIVGDVTSSNFIGLLIKSLTLFLLGFSVFQWGYLRARRYGTLSNY